MGDVNVQLVREYFELNLFQVMTNWQQGPRFRPGENSGQLFVRNTVPGLPRELPFLLHAGDVASIERAAVEIRAWHGDRFYPSVIEANPVLYEFVSGNAMTLAGDVFGQLPFTTILVVSELPAGPELRSRSLGLLQKTGIGHVIEFPDLLRELVMRVDEGGHYPASQTLQTLRLLKRYRLIRNQQMEFAFSVEAPSSSVTPRVDTTEADEDDEFTGDQETG